MLFLTFEDVLIYPLICQIFSAKLLCAGLCSKETAENRIGQIKNLCLHRVYGIMVVGMHILAQ